MSIMASRVSIFLFLVGHTRLDLFMCVSICVVSICVSAAVYSCVDIEARCEASYIYILL